MDELEFRRRIMSDPKERSSEIVDAIKADNANSKFAEDALELDAHIAKAMAVDVPEDLVDRILFNQTSYSEYNVVRPSFARRAMATAASVAFVFGLLVGQVNWGNILVPPAQASIADIAIKHVMDEKPFVGRIDENVPSSQISAKMMPFDHKLGTHFPYHVYYLNHCGFGSENALHMVFQGEKGKVTLFLTSMPTKQAVDFVQQGMAGIVEPMGNASLILVGEEGENVAKIAENIANIIKPMS
ncbi:chemotaxis protein [Vibrio zhanjiangensis]|uniref:Chemotaxis protein n=1 Tax=Vibrio zhanjiangensis TaxID=1046128 RepID=A0ABQ6EXL6_9VIBR|nr:DUF3379 domain-containing protein [Vibrio zhanjiangensis]GLT17431.1 chemotaxis protein [Vibrio zhanjiangensis]